MHVAEEVCQKAAAHCVPLSVHLDLTWRCNERCIHCYLENARSDEMGTAEFQRVFDQLAESGALFLTFSGGEVMLRKDLFEIVAYARSLLFDVRLKTNGILIGEAEAERFAQLGVREVHVSIYSDRAAVHDAITGVAGSLNRSIQAIRCLARQGIRTQIRGIIMRQNAEDYPRIQALAEELGVTAGFDPTITPGMDGGSSLIQLNIPTETLSRVFRDKNIVVDVEKFCAPPAGITEGMLDRAPCAAGNIGCYISPAGDVMPCVQFPVICGNVRRQSFSEIWRSSAELAAVRKIRYRDLPVCRTCVNLPSCTRCPGLAHMEGDMLGPSRLDCRKAFARTGIPTPIFPEARASEA